MGMAIKKNKKEVAESQKKKTISKKPVKNKKAAGTDKKSKKILEAQTVEEKSSSRKDKIDKNKKSANLIKEGKELAEQIKKTIPKDTIQGQKVKHRKKYYTHNGHELTIKEHKFIDEYIQTGNIRQSVIKAGYESKAPTQYGTEILNRPYIADEVEYRMTQEHNNRIATGEQVMEFFTKVMNGEIKDQFELDAPLSERLKAANELAKRTVDIANKVAGVTQGQNEVTIRLDFDRSEI